MIQSHAARVAMLRQLAAVPLTRVGRDDVLAGIVPFAHTFGSALLQHALRAGAKVVTLPRFELEAFLRIIEQHRVTVAFAVPPVARALARDPLVDRYDLSSLRLILLSAAPCPADIERECEERLGCTVAQGLGMSEAAPITLPSEPVCHGSAGRLVPSTEAVVVDPDSGARLDADATGELWVRGPQLMRGYLGDEPATLATIDAERVAAHRRPRALRRRRQPVRRRSPQGAHQGPRPSGRAGATRGRAHVASRGQPTPRWSRGQMRSRASCRSAYVALREPAETDAIAAWVAERVAPYKRLAEVIVLDQIPRSAAGKLLRRVLVERERAAARRPTASVA